MFASVLRTFRRATTVQQLQEAYFEQLHHTGWLSVFRLYASEEQRRWDIRAEFSLPDSPKTGIKQQEAHYATPAHAPNKLKIVWKPTELGAQHMRQLRRLHRYFADLYFSLQAAQSLRYYKSESERYEKLLDSISEGIAISDLNGNIFYANRAVREITGLALVGLNMRSLYLQQMSESDRAVMQNNLKARAKGESTSYNVSINSPRGEKNLTVRGVPLFAQDMVTPVATLAVIRDITEEQRTQKALEQSKQAAEKAQAAERQFLTQMSHEIRTPINAVVGMTHLLLQTQPSSQQLEYLKAIKFATESLTNIISNVLDLSKIEAGELSLDSQIFSLAKLVFSLQHFFQHQVRHKSVLVVACVDPAIQYQLIGDATRLNQILANLLSNACKFTHKGSIGILVDLKKQENDQYILHIEVRDTGIGIEEAHQAHIFQNFKQAHAHTHREFGGTGLGLPIVKHLVEMQKGSIRLESQINKGSNFHIELPFFISELPEYSIPDLLTPATLSPNPSPSNSISIQPLHNLRVLVAEDNALNQKLMLRLLEGWQIQADFVENGEDALLYLQNHVCDIVLMDVHMPRLDGCEATRRLRRQTDNPNNAVPVVALTAAALLDEKKRAFESGMTEFITKPFVPEQLLLILQKYAQHRNPNLNPVPNLPMIFELDYLRQLSNDDQQFIREILQSFLDDNPQDLNELLQAAQHQQVLQTSELLHKQQSTYALVGLKSIAQLARDLEQQLKRQAQISSEQQRQIQYLVQHTQQHYPLIAAWLGGSEK